MISSIAILALVVIFTIVGAKRGIAKTLLNLAGLVLAVILSGFFARQLSDFLYSVFIKETVIQNLQSAADLHGISYAAENYLQALPSWILSSITFFLTPFGLSISDLEKNIVVTEKLAASAVKAIEGAVRETVTGVFAFFFEIVLFILLLFLIKKIVKLVLVVFNIPVVKQINHLLGAVLGAAEGLVLAFAAVNIIGRIWLASNSELINNSMIVGELFKALWLKII